MKIDGAFDPKVVSLNPGHVRFFFLIKKKLCRPTGTQILKDVSVDKRHICRLNIAITHVTCKMWQRLELPLITPLSYLQI